MKLILNNIRVVGGTKVEFEYSITNELKKYFSKELFYADYSIDISSVPESILVIPFLANVLPIAWFAGFDVEVKEVDKTYAESLANIKKTFKLYYPEIKMKTSNFRCTNIIENETSVTKSKPAMLFSGGVDAYTTLLRHYEATPDLITVKGADIAVNDDEQWKAVVAYNESTQAIHNNKKFYIESNLRSFITFEVDQLLKGIGWWGKIQHGLALTSLTAPISFLNQYRNIYIASTRSAKMPFTPWGSMPEIDDLVKFSKTKVVHDGYELTRLDKVRTILTIGENFKIYPPLRVCYHDYKEDLNCNSCEKCCRTIFAIMVLNRDPNLYGFSTGMDVYRKVHHHLKNGFSTAGTKFYWDELIQSINVNDFYYFSNVEKEKAELEKIIIANKQAQAMGVSNKGNSAVYIYKQKLINKYPAFFNIYLNIRRKL